MRGYSFTPKARIDLASILLYTTDRWGKEQAKRYLRGFSECFELIAQTPGMVRLCERLHPGLRRIEQGKHVVFYLPKRDRVVIVRILHQKQQQQHKEFIEK